MEVEKLSRNELKRTIHRVPSLRTRNDICANLPDEDLSYEVDHLALNRMPRSSRVVKLKGPKTSKRRTLREIPNNGEYPQDAPNLANFQQSSRQEDHEASWGDMTDYDSEDTDTSTRHVIYSKFGWRSFVCDECDLVANYFFGFRGAARINAFVEKWWLAELLFSFVILILSLAGFVGWLPRGLNFLGHYLVFHWGHEYFILNVAVVIELCHQFTFWYFLGVSTLTWLSFNVLVKFNCSALFHAIWGFPSIVMIDAFPGSYRPQFSIVASICMTFTLLSTWAIIFFELVEINDPEYDIGPYTTKMTSVFFGSFFTTFCFSARHLYSAVRRPEAAMILSTPVVISYRRMNVGGAVLDSTTHTKEGWFKAYVSQGFSAMKSARFEDVRRVKTDRWKLRKSEKLGAEKLAPNQFYDTREYSLSTSYTKANKHASQTIESVSFRGPVSHRSNASTVDSGSDSMENALCEPTNYLNVVRQKSVDSDTVDQIASTIVKKPTKRITVRFAPSVDTSDLSDSDVVVSPRQNSLSRGIGPRVHFERKTSLL